MRHACQLKPGDYFANLMLGIDLLRINRSVEALPHLELAARAKPGEVMPEAYLGEAEANLGRFAQAAAAYQHAVQSGHGSDQSLEPWADFALERIRQIGTSLRTSAPAANAVRRTQDAPAKPAAALTCEGSIPTMERKLVAEQTGRSRANPEMETAYILSICYAKEAWNAVGSLRMEGEDPSAVHRLRGDVLLRLKGDAPAAEAEYKQAMSDRPGDPALMERLAEAQLAAGDREGARQLALAALAIDPHQREALRTLASLAMSNRDYGQALPWLRQLHGELPTDRTVQVELGTALAETGNANEALQQLAPALAAGYPDEKGALHALEARVLRELGRDAEAAKAVAEARHLSDVFQAHHSEGRTNADH